MNVAGFYEESISNGTGWRAVLFVSGCPHHCEGCHNEKTWSADYGEPYKEDKYLQLIKDSDIIKGITLSGGEPFLYAKELLPLVTKVKEMGLDVWAYTGYTLEMLNGKHSKSIDDLLNLVDVLIDGKFIKELKDPELKFRGSSNQRIIDLNKLREGHLLENCLLFEKEDWIHG